MTALNMYWYLSMVLLSAIFTDATQIHPFSTPQLEKRCTTYGCNVDQVDSAPPVDAVPATLANRLASPTTAPSFSVSGNYSQPCSGCLAGDWLLFYDSTYVRLSGTGYFAVRWEVGWGNTHGQINMPTWTALEGKLFHVASGGGHRMDDFRPGSTDCTWMGCASLDEVDTLPSGAQQMWQNEFYFLDGAVTLWDVEGAVDYNLGVASKTWQDVSDDINTAPDSSSSSEVRYGKTRDTTGNDGAPVPQYLTRDDLDLAGARTVAQQSKVS